LVFFVFFFFFFWGGGGSDGGGRRINTVESCPIWGGFGRFLGGIQGSGVEFRGSLPTQMVRGWGIGESGRKVRFF
jgi:hypothetical protein